MKLLLSNETTLNDVNRQFQSQFPHLSLEFYRHKHQPGETSLFEKRISSHTPLKNVSDLVPGSINIDPGDTVADIEQRFQDKFGLPVQIFRRAGDVWLETAETDGLSLQKQNNMAVVGPRLRFNVNRLFL